MFAAAALTFYKYWCNYIQFLRPGHEQIAAALVIYGPQTSLVRSVRAHDSETADAARLERERKR
jgi:fructose-1,6-bisphosphatase